MKTIYKAAALALAPVTALAMGTVPALAQSKSGVAVVSLSRAVGTSAAYAAARTQISTTYKAQIDSITARKASLEAAIKVKADALQAAYKAAGNKSTPAIETQYNDLQKSQQDAQTELQRLSQPIQLANAYVEEQIVAKLEQALKTAMTKTKAEVVLKEEATESFLPATDITDEVTAELNTLVPSVGITPPAGWQPGRQGQAPAAAPANPTQQPQSR